MSLNRRERDSIGNQYKIYRILLLSLSVWPFQQSKYTILIRSFHFGIMISFTFFQLTSFLTNELVLDVVIMILSYALPSCICMIQYHSFCSNSYIVKRIWEDIYSTWNLMRNETEHKIMRQYKATAEYYTKLFLTIIISSCIIYGIFEAMPVILDIILPLNKTRPREIHALLEYFIDKDAYFFPILCHWLIGLIIGCYTIICVSTSLMICVQHISGLFKVANYRIEHSADDYVFCNSIQEKNRIEKFIQNISAAVDIHRTAIERCEYLIDKFNKHFFFMLVIGVTSLSLNLFRLLKAIITLDEVEIVSSILFTSGHFVIMFGINYYGQQITDYHSEIFTAAYNVRWYVTPVKIQKLLLFIMQSTTKAYYLNIGNLIVASIEGFSKLVSMAISYFTLIYSLL
ncbi:hypothetical protein DMN91_010002 [Ooceraea biroi]|uniref:Odorant receptor n=2 Tax=Ooceraea biroi TaxID=2015173 RepID=A0A3L8DB83_OOCBI|nr:hypothetical protein DMN91_010002 [Ooceraea biroi]